MRLFTALLFPFLLLPAADSNGTSNFNGRWYIQLLKPQPDKAWWLEVSGAGTPAIKGRFIGFPGGDLNEITDLKIDNGVLSFSDGKTQGRREYTITYVNGRLQGRMTGAGDPLEFTGYRAPVMRDREDGSWMKTDPVTLFNGKDLTGWTGLGSAENLGWTVENGLLKSTGHARNLITTGAWWNFILRVEYNVARNSNSGIGLRGRYEVQIQDDYGKPVESHINGAIYSRIKPLTNASRKAGEWQSVDIRLVGRDVSVTLNGTPIIVRQKIEGLTAIAFTPFEGEPGPIELQGDHGPVEFRNIVLTPLYQPQ
jgi:hypothetical protein